MVGICGLVGDEGGRYLACNLLGLGEHRGDIIVVLVFYDGAPAGRTASDYLVRDPERPHRCCTRTRRLSCVPGGRRCLASAESLSHPRTLGTPTPSGMSRWSACAPRYAGARVSRGLACPSSSWRSSQSRDRSRSCTARSAYT